MKKGIIWITSAIVAAAVFIGVFYLYRELSEKYAPDPFSGIEITDTGKVTAADTDSEESAKTTAPDFTVIDGEGKEVKLSDYFGKPIVLNFWATWCHYCKEEMPDFNNAYKNHPDVRFLMVNVTDGTNETVDGAKKYVSDNGFEFPILFDTKLNAVSTYGASGLPMTVFIDAEGNLVTYARGMLTAEQLERGIGYIK